MDWLSVIKSAAVHALDDDSEESKEGRMAEFRSIVGPRTALELMAEIERCPSPEDFAELIQILREMTEYLENQRDENARILTMKAKVLL